jgi:hypothetical protein
MLLKLKKKVIPYPLEPIRNPSSRKLDGGTATCNLLTASANVAIGAELGFLYDWWHFVTLELLTAIG